MNVSRWTIALVAPFLFGAQPVIGCSTTNNYLRPSNYELVKTTERIALAQVSAIDSKTCTTRLAFIKAIKGELPASELVIRGCESSRLIPAMSEDDFSDSRSAGGSCNANSYRSGSTYLLFLRSDAGKWEVGGPAFSRVSEEVAGSDSPWVRAVAEYARIATLNDYAAEKRELRALQTRARTDIGASAALQALIGDIDRHFRTPSDQKNYEDLLALYQAATDDDQRRRVLWAWANRGDTEARPVFHDLLARNVSGLEGPLAAYLSKVGDRQSVDALAALFFSREADDWMGRHSTLFAVCELADDSDLELLLQVFDRCSDEEASIVGKWFARHPGPAGVTALQQRIGHDYIKKHELTIALAGAGDPAIVGWAANLLRTRDEYRWVGLYVLANSPLPSADAQVGEIIESRSPDLVVLAQAYAESVSPFRMQRLANMIALPNKSAELDAWLWRALQSAKADGGNGADALLEQLPAKAAAFFDR